MLGLRGDEGGVTATQRQQRIVVALFHHTTLG
jgi:hypothetical protein